MKDSKNIVNLADFKTKKNLKAEISQDRTPLYVSHLEGKVKGSPHFKSPDAEDFGDRLTRIRSSLERINQLMAELRKSVKDQKTPPKSSVTPLS